ncbi:glutathione S-transferase N-terminal domain-containing protein [Jiella sp. KSK16Y-1]|uniref:Glutathione S-transferase N-terminal domain-containing protein n=2 Tax=Jiella mangrovi TaxID=2821407 RepID=A0ABS4BK08_9HYPH|nr:glutathione S-transferase N-terminal domain-containing protein [Jiella mangrovi]
MIMRTTLTSPFGRKARIAADVLELSGRIDIVPADTRDESDDLREMNPLGKMPCLVLTDGTTLYDSRVILDYFDALSGGGRLLPPGGLPRHVAMTRATLADGIADAALLMVYEGRFREPHQASDVWMSHQRGKISRGLAAFAADLPNPEVTDVVSISLACALGYLDWRQPYDWREPFPRIAAWLEAFAAAEPAFAATQRPGA